MLCAVSTEVPPTSTASELLDLLARGDVDAALALVGDQTLLKVPGLSQTWQGREKIAAAVAAARTRFEGLDYLPHTRHIGEGRVVDDATFSATMSGTGDPLSSPTTLRLTHDGATISGITVDVPPIVIRMGQGQRIDHRELAVALAVTRLTTPEHGLQTFALTQAVPMEPGAPVTAPVMPKVSAYDVPKPRPKIELPMPPPPAPPKPERAGRRKGLIVALMALLLAAGGGGAWVVLSSGGDEPSVTPSETPTATKTTTSPTPKPSKTPTPTKTATPPPTIVLTADLAFASDSATLSAAARAKIRDLAAKARRAGVKGTIRVDGYTDNVGSAEHGLELSQARADAVAAILRDALSGLDVTIQAVGHGEADPIASNATAAGRAKNRRVSITLPPTIKV